MKIDAALKAKKAWETFVLNHPKFPQFLENVKGKGITPGTVIEINVKYEDGTEIKSGTKLKESDLELLNLMK